MFAILSKLLHIETQGIFHLDEERLPTSLLPPLVPHPLPLWEALFLPLFCGTHPPTPTLLSSLHKGCPIFQGPVSMRNKGSEWAWQGGLMEGWSR